MMKLQVIIQHQLWRKKERSEKEGDVGGRKGGGKREGENKLGKERRKRKKGAWSKIGRELEKENKRKEGDIER